MQIYTENVDGEILHSDFEKIISDLMLKYIGIDMSSMSMLSEMSPAASITL